MSMLSSVLSSPLLKLAIGVLIAIAVHLWKKRNGSPTYSDMLEEARVLLPPAALVAVAFLASGSPWTESVEAFLLALAVPLGINSKKAGQDAPKAPESKENGK